MESQIAFIEGFQIVAIDGRAHVGYDLVEVEKIECILLCNQTCGKCFQCGADLKAMNDVCLIDQSHSGAAGIGAFNKPFAW